MTCIHEKKKRKIDGRSLLHDIINLSKRTKILNNHYYIILHGWMNKRKDIAKFKNFRILLNSEFSSIILMGSLIKKLTHKEDDVMQ